MLRKFIQVEDGIIRGRLEVDLPEEADGPAGLVEVSADTDLTDATFRAYTDGVIGDKVVDPPRAVTLRAFLQRCTVAERVAFNTARNADPVAEVLWAELLAGPTVELDSAALITGLAYIKGANATGGFLLWPDNATADARIAA